MIPSSLNHLFILILYRAPDKPGLCIIGYLSCHSDKKYLFSIYICIYPVDVQTAVVEVDTCCIIIQHVVYISCLKRYECAISKDILLSLIQLIHTLICIRFILRSYQQLINFRILILAVVVRAVALEQFKVAVRIIIVRSPSAITNLIIMLWEYFAVDVSICYLTDLYVDSKCILPLLLKSLLLESASVVTTSTVISEALAIPSSCIAAFRYSVALS